LVEKLTINQLLIKGIDLLGERDFLNPFLDAHLLLGYTLNVDKVYLYTHKDDIIDEEHVDKYIDLINKRRGGYPLQYIIGKQEFMGLDFNVGEGVLIPRPDTEILVEALIDLTSKGDISNRDNINILDIGTGSGAITLSLAHYIKNAYVYSIDISDKALDIAKINCESLGLQSKVRFLKGDLFSPLRDLDLKDEIDIIVSNPPYIPSKDIDELQSEVADFEPRLALDGGIDGLDYYRNIVKQSTDYLAANGILAFEIGYDQGLSVKKLLEENGSFRDIEIRKDLSGNDRVVIAYRK